MNVLLTGISGNLGYEVSQALKTRALNVVAMGRSNSIFQGTNILCDLTDDKDLIYSGKADCIIHCAGVVKFHKSGNPNLKMIKKVITLAQKKNVPVYFVSTAFVYRPNKLNTEFNNNYEQDKYLSELELSKSGLHHTIFRPSVITGNSTTGHIQNFSGYYTIVDHFLNEIQKSFDNKKVLRFPALTGFSNILPVDKIARDLVQCVVGGNTGIIYLTNPRPPKASWVFNQTMNFFGLSDKIELLDCTIEEFERLNLTQEENNLLLFSKHFSPYWSINYKFPKSYTNSNPINAAYLNKILTYFKSKKIYEN